jgi:hypothetical protein
MNYDTEGLDKSRRHLNTATRQWNDHYLWRCEVICSVVPWDVGGGSSGGGPLECGDHEWVFGVVVDEDGTVGELFGKVR